MIMSLKSRLLRRMIAFLLERLWRYEHQWNGTKIHGSIRKHDWNIQLVTYRAPYSDQTWKKNKRKNPRKKHIR